jgi:hypothetical protein
LRDSVQPQFAGLRYKSEAMIRRFIVPFAVVPASFLAWTGLAAAPQTAPASSIQIRVVEGEGAINSIRLHRAHDPVIQVVDRDGQAVAGATVTFILPAMGASGTFQDNGLSLTVDTDGRGMAAARGMRPNRLEGAFRIRVTASWQGQSAGAEITERNAEPVIKSGNSKKIAILALIGGAAAAGVAVAAHGGKSSTTDTGATGGSTGGATITAGSPSFGPPR